MPVFVLHQLVFCFCHALFSSNFSPARCLYFFYAFFFQARELEVGRERARLLFKADTQGRKVTHNNG